MHALTSFTPSSPALPLLYLHFFSYSDPGKKILQLAELRLWVTKAPSHHRDNAKKVSQLNELRMEPTPLNSHPSFAADSTSQKRLYLIHTVCGLALILCICGMPTYSIVPSKQLLTMESWKLSRPWWKFVYQKSLARPNLFHFIFCYKH